MPSKDGEREGGRETCERKGETSEAEMKDTCLGVEGDREENGKGKTLKQSDRCINEGKTARKYC